MEVHSVMRNTKSSFGGCPICKGQDGYINIASAQWFYCEEHKKRWCAGWGLFSIEPWETKEFQEAIYNELDFGSFEIVEPVDISG
jgi:hypothetical protein